MKKLRLELEMQDNYEVFNYIIESYINGQKKQFTNLMTDFINCTAFNKQVFQSCILNSCDTFGLEKTINILKKYNTFEYSISDNTIINVFYDNSIGQLNEVKKILLTINS